MNSIKIWEQTLKFDILGSNESSPLFTSLGKPQAKVLNLVDPSECVEWRLSGRAVPVVEDHKYLGVRVKSKRRFGGW